MHLRLNLQSRVLLLVTAGMTVILLLSNYLHGLVTAQVIEEDRYHTAVSQTVAIAERIAALQWFSHLDSLQRDIAVVARAHGNFRQIDIYRDAPGGRRMVASTAPTASRLAVLDEHTPDNDLREMEQPLEGVVTMEM